MLGDVEKAALAEDLARFQHDPLGYVLWCFPWGVPGTELERKTGPRTWQREVLQDVGRKVATGKEIGQAVREAVSSGHGIGKSTIVAWLVRWGIATHEDARGVVTANTATQLGTKTWPEIAKWNRLALDRELFVLTATALYSSDPNHEKTWRVDAVPWSKENTEAFAGLHNEGKRIIVVFDEASGIEDKIWEVTEGALTDSGTEIIWAVFGNPTNATGAFRECFRKNRHRWNARHVDSREVDGTNKDLFAQWVADHGEDSDFVKVRVRGIFPAQSLKQYISEADVDAAYGRELRQESYDFAPVVLAVEPAWEGDDELVIAKRQGLFFVILRTLARNDNDVWVANEVARLEDEHSADAVFVDAGYGTGIVSAGRTMGRSWQLVWFAGQPNDAGCLNKRAEIWKLMRDWLKEGGAIPKDALLRDEIIAPQTVARMDGKLQLEAKKDMKARGVPSPNRADALAITFAAPVSHRGIRGVLERIRNGKTSNDYDPYAEDR